MARKTANKKKNQLSNGKKQATPNPNSWPNLPNYLTSLMARQPNLWHNITSFGCVTKSWRSPPRQCTNNSQLPQLVEIYTKTNARTHIILSPIFRNWCLSYYERRISFNEFVFKIAILEDPNNYIAMVLTGTNSLSFVFYKPGKRSDWEWTVENCNIKELYGYGPSQNMQFSNAIGFKGKFYALSLQGSVVVVEDVDSCFRITRIGANRAVPSKASRQFREYLVESDGEILLVFLMSRKSINVVEDVEVFRLDIAKLLWVKVERIGDRALFLEDDCCMWVNASKVGCKKNCIYFTHHRLDQWLVFDMESGHILPAFGNE